MPLPPVEWLVHAWVMTQNEAEWRLELEESAQGTDLFEAPGAEVQAEEAREDAVEPLADPLGTGNSTPRVEAVRAKRHSLGKTMIALESAVASPAGAVGWLEEVSEAIDELGEALEDATSRNRDRAHRGGACRSGGVIGPSPADAQGSDGDRLLRSGAKPK